MPGNLPQGRIDRGALERIIRRAAELQAGDMDTGEGLTEQDLLKVGAEVGIDGRFLRQAMYEETAGGAASEGGALTRWVGPRRVSASRVVPGDRASIEAALEHWMIEGEALAIKRRLPDRTVWERQRGFFAEMKRGFGVGGKSYHLARAHDVAVVVTALEQGFCHVELVADIAPTRQGFLGGGVAVGGAGLAMGLTASALGAPLVIPVVAAVLGLSSGALIARAHRRSADRMQLALEQVLDRLEHGEIRPRHQTEGQRGFPLLRIAEEIRTAIADAAQTRQPPRRLPPG
jgi:hypothetical protein